MNLINIETKDREELIDITHRVVLELNKNMWSDGLLFLYTPHTTTAITINENADPSVQNDISVFLSKLVPTSEYFTHMEGNADAHIKSSIIGCSAQIIVENNAPVLGTWQGIFFCEFDGPRKRKLYLKFFKNIG